MQYYSATGIHQLVRIVLVVFAVLVVIIPISALHYVKSIEGRLGLVAFFSTIFALCVSTFTQSRNFEIFVALAA